MSVDVEFLARAFDKPVEYVKRCVKFHGITSLPKLRTPDDGLGAFYSDMTAHFSDEPSRTKQEFTAECDINNIMARFAASNYDPSTLPMTSRKPMYGDFTGAPESYHAALNYVRDTERAFMELPAEFRAKLENDPQKFLDYIQDPANYDELVDLGFLLPSSSDDPRSPNSAVGASDDIPQGGSIPPKGKSSSKAPKNANDGAEGASGE